MKRVQQHHELMVKIQKHRNVFVHGTASPRSLLTSDSETQRQIATDSDDNMETSDSTTC